MRKKSTVTGSDNAKDAPGISLEKVVVRIQQMMDPNSTVTHNEVLLDRVGNNRQYDVVVRGQFGGRPVLGIIECKDNSRKKGPDAIEAFAKKTENLGANLRIIVSKKGFTKQALKLAKHENVDCISLLPENPAQIGFSLGGMWYGIISLWKDVRYYVCFAMSPPPLASFDFSTVKWEGKQVEKWFARELLTTRAKETKEGEHRLELRFDQPCNMEIEGNEYAIVAIGCIVNRVYQKKQKWVSWSGDAFYDWHKKQMIIPPNGTIMGSFVESDLSLWSNFDGEIPDINVFQDGIQGLVYNIQEWDIGMDHEVPDLSNL